VLKLFRARLPIDDDEFEWLVACFAWLNGEFGDMERLRRTALVLPDSAFFPPSVLDGHARAEELFDQVKALCGMRDWDCDLEPGEASREFRVTTGHALRHHSSPPAGTFGYRSGRYFITYNPALIARPHKLVATFAHELAHFLMHSAQTRPPGGPELEEHATDLAAVFLGFGLFMANSSRDFRQFNDFGESGWESSRVGYLSELALVTALALFARLTGADAKPAER